MSGSNSAERKRYEPLVLVETADLSEEDWLDYRRRGIGGSDVSAIFGTSPFRTARDLYYDKLNIASVEDDEGNWVAMEMGHLLEPLVAKIFERKTGYRVYQIKKMFQHPQYPWMLADVDYFVELPDIGGFTADYLLMKNGEIDLTSCDSLENGVILLYNKVRSKVNSELDLLLDEGDVDAILMGQKTQYPDAAIRLTEQMAQEFINDLFSTLRERMLDLQYCKVVFVGGGAILLKRQIETSGKVGTPFFVPKINANADGYEYLYRIETAGR